MLMNANGDSPRDVGNIRVRESHLGIRKRATSCSRNSRHFWNRSVNNRDMSDFRNFRNYRSAQFFDWSTLFMSGAVWNDRKIKSVTYNCAQRNYFRFAATILKTDCNRLGQSQTVRIHPGNTSDTWGTARKNNFRFAAATDYCIWNWLPCTVGIRPENTSKGLYSGINMIIVHTNRSGDVGPVDFDR